MICLYFVKQSSTSRGVVVRAGIPCAEASVPDMAVPSSSPVLGCPYRMSFPTSLPLQNLSMHPHWVLSVNWLPPQLLAIQLLHNCYVLHIIKYYPYLYWVPKIQHCGTWSQQYTVLFKKQEWLLDTWGEPFFITTLNAA